MVVIHEQEMALCVSHASSVASAVGASVSRGCLFATLYVSQEAAATAAAAVAVAPAASHGTGGRTPRINGDGWLQGMVDECRILMEARCAQEQAEAAAEAAGTGAAGEGDDDSAEDGWTSDPEELAKEAARKMVRVVSVEGVRAAGRLSQMLASFVTRAWHCPNAMHPSLMAVYTVVGPT